MRRAPAFVPLLKYVLKGQLQDSSTVARRQSRPGGGRCLSDATERSISELQALAAAADGQIEPNAIGYVKRFPTQLKMLVFRDSELPGYGLVPLPESRSPQAGDTHIAVGTRGGSCEGGGVEPRHTVGAAAACALASIRSGSIRQHLIGALRVIILTGALIETVHGNIGAHPRRNRVSGTNSVNRGKRPIGK